MELPSKELLKEVLGLKISSFDLYPDAEASILGTGYFISLTTVKGVGKAINIYELMHLMKEWIRSKGYEIQIKLIERDGNVFIEFVDWRDGDSKFGEDVFKGRTEWETMVIFAEWILKESK